MNRAFVIATKMTGLALLPTPLLLFVMPSNLLRAFIAQLITLVLFGLVVTVRLAREVEPAWFDARSTWRRAWSTRAAAVAMATGSVALVTLASSAALRFEPSLQYLQLLSALDIAWATGALYLGVSLKKAELLARLAGALLIALCVFSIWNYLTIFGFTPEGGWLVDEPGLLRYVIPGDVAAAAIALSALTWGTYPQGEGSG